MLVRESTKNEANSQYSTGISRFLSRGYFSYFSHIALVIYSIGAALSIALSQSVVSALLIYWIFCNWNWRREERGGEPRGRDSLLGGSALLAVPMVCWVLVSLTSTLIGINPLRSLPEIFKTSFYLLLPFCVYSSLTCQRLSESEFLRRIRTYLVGLIAGQAFAALHTIINTGFDEVIKLHPPGPVTESGQAVLTIAAIVSLLFLGQRTPQARNNSQANWLWEYGMPLATLAGSLFLAWGNHLQNTPLQKFVLPVQFFGAALLLLFIPRISRNLYKWIRRPLLFRGVDSHEFRSVLVYFSSLVFAAFVINLKRGPWLGVFSLCLIVGSLLSRRLIIVTVSLSVLLIVALAPARERVLRFANDFAISGGRQNMWEMGLELTQRYPLGLGLNNASVIRQLDPSLPEQHRHMHNNLLNVSAESGLIGLLIFVWWIVSAIQIGVRGWILRRKSVHRHERQRALLALTLTSGLIGWQVAGLVEYNFGDGEVVMIALLLMGLVLAAVSGEAYVPRRRPTRESATIVA